MKRGRALAAIGLLTLCGCGTTDSDEPAAVPIARPVVGAHAPRTPGAPSTLPNQLSAQEAMALLLKDRDRYWQLARKEVYRSARSLAAQHEDEREQGLIVSKLLQGDRRRKEIALTFDDGPHPSSTPLLLAILKRYRIPATFFVVGEMAEKHPDLIRAEQAAGMAIGNHTYHHVSLTRIPEEFVLDEIKACGDVIRDLTGTAPHWFRPPGGRYDTGVAEASEALGYTMALWTDDPADYLKPVQPGLLKRTLDRATPGGILLLHDGPPDTIALLPELIQTLRRRGYTFVTLDRLKGSQPEPRRPRATGP